MLGILKPFISDIKQSCSGYDMCIHVRWTMPTDYLYMTQCSTAELIEKLLLKLLQLR